MLELKKKLGAVPSLKSSKSRKELTPIRDKKIFPKLDPAHSNKSLPHFSPPKKSTKHIESQRIRTLAQKLATMKNENGGDIYDDQFLSNISLTLDRGSPRIINPKKKNYKAKSFFKREMFLLPNLRIANNESLPPIKQSYFKERAQLLHSPKVNFNSISAPTSNMRLMPSVYGYKDLNTDINDY